MKTLDEMARVEDDHQLLLRSEIYSESGYGRTEEDFDKNTDHDKFIKLSELKAELRKWIEQDIIILKEYGLENPLEFAKSIVFGDCKVNAIKKDFQKEGIVQFGKLLRTLKFIGETDEEK